jgi:hypothetical protein
MSFPEFSEQGKGNRDIFYSGYNDITIFVEDEKLEHFYTYLFSDLLSGYFDIKRVFPLGGKGPVLKQYKKYKNGEIELNNPIFLLDRDLDPFLNIELIEDDMVIYLKDYCIENYLISEEAFCYSLSWQFQKQAKELLEEGIFRDWEIETLDTFFKLFIAYILCRKYELGTNVDQSPFKFIKNKSYVPDIDKISSYIDQLAHKFNDKYSKTRVEFEDELLRIENEILAQTHNNKKTVISGKYLFVSLYKYAQYLCVTHDKKARLDENWFFGLLSEKMDQDRISFIKDRAVELYA